MITCSSVARVCPAGVRHGGVPGEDPRLQRAAAARQRGGGARHRAGRAARLRVLGPAARGPARPREEPPAAGRGPRARPLPAGGARRGPLPPRGRRARRPQAAQVRVRRREKVSGFFFF